MEVGMGTQPQPEGGEGAGSGTPPPRPDELAPHFPQLEILEVIGQGGMGMVYRARQRKLDRVVALKVLSRDAAKDPAFSERFNREARALARLNHPNIVTVHDFGETDGWFYLVMEYVDGADLRRVLQQGRLSPEEALRIVPVVCDALQYAHANGVVHRDIKPGNILMDREGRVKIADFGIAKLAGQTSADVTLTQSKQSMGTPHYMAPEQVESPLTVDHRADIYSLGVVFYEMLTGELPLGRFAPPSRRVQVDVRLDEVVLRALEKEPDRRYQQVGDVKTEVERITGSQGSAKGGNVEKPVAVGAPWGAETCMGLGVAWVLIAAWLFGRVMNGLMPVEEAPATVILWKLLNVGAFAPLGATVLGWLALRDTDRRRGGARMLSWALGMMTLATTVALGLFVAALAMSMIHEVFRVRNIPLALGLAGVVTLLTLGWLGYRLRRWCLAVLSIEARSRPPWFPWLVVVPIVVSLFETRMLMSWVDERHSAWNRPPKVALSDLMYQPVSLPSDPFSEYLTAPRWTMSPSGPVLTDTLATQVLGSANPPQRAALERALQSAWTEYREALKSHLQRTTNSSGHVVIEVRPMVPELEAIANRFWTTADAVLNPNQQSLMREFFGPQFRPHWVTTERGRLYVTHATLLRFGDLPYFLEFWREGSWYRHRMAEGEVSVETLGQMPDQRSPELPEDRRILVEGSESPGSDR
jgi:tRNA A-37 threonylcarbamoyl transferase component Bud32